MPLMATAFSLKFVFEKNENKEKDDGVGPLKELPIQRRLQIDQGRDQIVGNHHRVRTISMAIMFLTPNQSQVVPTESKQTSMELRLLCHLTHDINCIRANLFTFNQFYLGSVTRWPHCFFNIWPFTMMKFCPIAIIVKIGSKYCQILNKAFEKLPKTFRNLSQNGEISHNLVTLYLGLMTSFSTVQNEMLHALPTSRTSLK